MHRENTNEYVKKFVIIIILKRDISNTVIYLTQSYDDILIKNFLRNI